MGIYVDEFMEEFMLIPNTEYGKRNYIFRWEFMLILICD